MVARRGAVERSAGTTSARVNFLIRSLSAPRRMLTSTLVTEAVPVTLGAPGKVIERGSVFFFGGSRATVYVTCTAAEVIYIILILFINFRHVFIYFVLCCSRKYRIALHPMAAGQSWNCCTANYMWRAIHTRNHPNRLLSPLHTRVSTRKRTSLHAARNDDVVIRPVQRSTTTTTPPRTNKTRKHVQQKHNHLRSSCTARARSETKSPHKAERKKPKEALPTVCGPSRSVPHYYYFLSNTRCRSGA